MMNILVIDDDAALLDLVADTLRLDGHDVTPQCGQLGKTRFTGPVLFMSGYPALAGAVAGSPEERGVLEKPFTARRLRTAVRRALARSKPRFHAPLDSICVLLYDAVGKEQ